MAQQLTKSQRAALGASFMLAVGQVLVDIERGTSRVPFPADSSDEEAVMAWGNQYVDEMVRWLGILGLRVEGEGLASASPEAVDEGLAAASALEAA